MERGDRPQVSVVVRSFERPAALHELLRALRAQRHASFEIVVVDQSDDPRLVASVAALGDPRIRLVVRPPLGPCGARNEGIRHARGELLVFIDDDDLPVGDGWIAAHVANYGDPGVQGVAGRNVADAAQAALRRVTRRARRRAMRTTFFGDGTAYAWLGERKEEIDFLFGSNFSLRRALVERIGGWDEVPGLLWGEEQSFSLRFQRERRDGERFVFDPEATAVRRTDVPGGCARRAGTGWARRELRSRVIFYHRIAAHYRPWRFWLLWPLAHARILAGYLEWMLTDDDNRHHPLAARLAATLAALAAYPWIVARDGLAPAPVRRQPSMPYSLSFL